VKRTEQIARHKGSGKRKAVRDAKRIAARAMRREAKRDPENAEQKRRNRGWADF
jgi:hypothetical protein